MTTHLERTTATQRPRIVDRAAAVERAAALYRGGKTVREVAAELGLSYNGAHSLLTSAGVEFRSRGGNPRKGV